MDICPYCNLNFSKDFNKKEHILKCQNIKNIQHKDTFQSTPSLHSVYKMVLELQKENTKLKKKIKRLEDKAFKKKEKKTIFEWLNLYGNNIYDEQLKNMSKMIDNIKPTEYHLIHLFQSGYVEGYGTVIENFYKNNGKNYLIAWEQKKQIYCWEDEWCKFTIEDISTIISKIQKQMMKLFSEWMTKQRNNMQINKYMGMILGGEINERKKKNKTIYLNLWNLIKKDFHKETEYQITF
jgi:hypothetical protein